LSSPTLYKFGLEAALEELLEDKLRGEHHIQYRFSDDHAPKPLSQDVLVLLFQSVRELLINVIKHAQAHEVTLDIRRQIDCIRVTVADDGTGFDVDEVLSSPSRGRSVGLFNIRERLDYIGGTLDINSEPGRGSRFVLVAPLKTEVHATKESHDGGEDSAR
ncbi:MAG TPA: ATP-binding protein, partial [Sedimentisphaerales bacterium]|nr:ATP-binding protein [Sedimentisphaerales bacterium]